MGIRVAKAEKKRAITGVIATFELSRGEYFSEKLKFFHLDHPRPCQSSAFSFSESDQGSRFHVSFQ